MVWRNADGMDYEGALRRHALIVLDLAQSRRPTNRRVAGKCLTITFSSFHCADHEAVFINLSCAFGMRESGPLSVIGANTIAIYTTHRILVELFSFNANPKH